MDKHLLDILCCPVSKTPVRPLQTGELERLNQAIARGEVDTVAGARVEAALTAGLVTTDGRVVYRIEDDIPVMLPEEGIGTTQLREGL
ncbi:Trm112 family protein [Oleiagrimonas soli]|uniref:Uncharacterized protein YbaR (Trm112 family) n=1 Tax=Oleiagrimonas soli TaxID=1543381 RepID=A0A099CYH0_9GAMM|nr:Trm112 family protein [Oleiagrimonas soli]KGI78657.1 hypothetical protein LF63_0104260 [Oleiagrimonas soli]MBB6184034.1 uncharacterized protein YbaR (Trm112 family) [Oleiagrimonas soli]